MNVHPQTVYIDLVFVSYRVAKAYYERARAAGVTCGVRRYDESRGRYRGGVVRIWPIYSTGKAALRIFTPDLPGVP